MSSTTAPIERPRISACIIAFNEAGRIGDCLASLAFCDEIVVVDSYSTDATVAIAEAAGARVLQRPFDGFRSQKAYCVEQAGHDWVLCLTPMSGSARNCVRPSNRPATVASLAMPAIASHACRSTSASSCAMAMPTRTG